MNLRNVHLIFITLSVLLAVGLAAWALGRPAPSTAEMALGVLSILAAVGLVAYGISFRRRSRYW